MNKIDAAISLGLFGLCLASFAYADLNNPSSSVVACIASSTPNPDILGGSVGTSGCAMRADAAIPTRSRRTTVQTLSDGTFSVTWSKSLNSSTPVVNLVPVNTGTNQIVCNPTALATSTTVNGKCWQTNSILGANLSLLGLGTSVNLANAPSNVAANVNVYVFAIEPTQ